MTLSCLYFCNPAPWFYRPVIWLCSTNHTPCLCSSGLTSWLRSKDFAPCLPAFCSAWLCWFSACCPDCLLHCLTPVLILSLRQLTRLTLLRLHSSHLPVVGSSFGLRLFQTCPSCFCRLLLPLHQNLLVQKLTLKPIVVGTGTVLKVVIL